MKHFEPYFSINACFKALESAVRPADLDSAFLGNHKFEVYTDKAGEYRFRLKARNGEIIAASEGYKAKASCLNGIESVRKNAPDAEVVEAEA